MPSGTSISTWTSWRARPRKESRIWTPDNTTTSCLAASAELEDPLASIGRRKIGRPLRNSWRSHSQPLPGCWTTSCSISGSTPFPIRLPLRQGPICLLRLEVGLRWSGKDGEASVGREGSFKLLIYINKNIR